MRTHTRRLFLRVRMHTQDAAAAHVSDIRHVLVVVIVRLVSMNSWLRWYTQGMATEAHP